MAARGWEARERYAQRTGIAPRRRLGMSPTECGSHWYLAPGDFNGDGKVDAADYVVWRKYDGNDATGYATWRANFGTPAGSGAAVATVPEPPAALLMIVAVAILAIRGHNSINGRCRTGTSRVSGIFILSLIAVASNVPTAHALTFQLTL